MGQNQINQVVLFTFSMLLLGTADGRCRIINVPTNAESIWEAAEVAFPGDTIALEPGVYSGPSNRGVYIRDKHLTICSTGGPLTCIIDCQGQDRAFFLDSFYPEYVFIQGITFRNGLADLGGAIRVNGPTVITNCIFENNSALEGGGAIYSSTMELSNCEFVSNHAGSSEGGGAVVSHFVTITGCTFLYNTSSGDGGAFRYNFLNHGYLNVSNSDFINNTADGSGGGIFTTSETCEITDCTFSMNRAAQGAGVDCRETHMKFVLLTNNLADDQGSAVYLSEDNLIIEQCTIAYNVSRHPDGGGIYAASTASLQAMNSILWGNSDDLSITTTPILSNCIIGNCDLSGVSGNFAMAPRFNSPLVGDFSLRPDSPCIDRGQIGSDPYQGDAPDIGAIESPYSGTVPFAEPMVVNVGPGEQFTTLTEALNIAGFPGSTILLFAGFYSNELFPLPLYGVSLIGQGLSSQVVLHGASDRSVLITTCSNSPSIENCSIEGGGAGGVWILDGSPIFDHCTIRLNSNADMGGGVYCSNASDASFAHCSITDNHAYSGGGIYLKSGSVSLLDCSITHNQADWDGGGICVASSGIIDCERSLIFQNQAGRNGGAVVDAGASSIIHSNVLLNIAPVGGGLVIGNSSEVLNSIIWMNTDDVYFRSGATPVIQNNSIGDGDQVGVNGNFSAPPSFVDIAAADYQLSPGSAAIDRGLDIGESFSGNAPDVGMYESDTWGPLPLPSPCVSTIGVGADYLSILTALNECNIPGSSLSLLQGIYDENSGEIMPIVLYGVNLNGLAGPDLTDLVGDSTHHVLHISPISPSSLNGLSISEGGNSGIRITTGGLEINNCHIRDNREPLSNGGGIYSNTAQLIIINSVIQDNYAKLDGGGVFCGGANSQIIDCVLEGNHAERDGGGAYLSGTAPIVQGSTITRNTADISSGGIYSSSSLSMTRCVITENQDLLDAGGVQSNYARLTHCTIALNRSTRGCDGVKCRGSTSYPIKNCIFWGHCDDLQSSSGTLTVEGCDIGEEGWAGSNGNISSPPMFINPLEGDYTLAPDSPCIDRGIDLGEPFAGSAPDIGAFETTQTSPPPYPAPCNIVVGIGGDFETLTEAISYCNIPGSTISVLPGVYNSATGEIFPIPLIDVVITGSGPPESVVIESDQIHAVFKCSHAVGFCLKNLTITEGSSGLKSELCSGEILNCRFTNNNLFEPAYIQRGGAIYSRESNLQIQDTQFLSNDSHSGSAMTLEYDSVASVDRCLFSGNFSDTGSCIEVWNNTELTMNQCFIFGNRSKGAWGTTINVVTSIVNMTNCTVTRNTSDSVGGITIVDGDGTFINSIIWGNTDDLSIDDESAVVFEHCDIANSESISGEGNIAVPPDFDLSLLLPMTPRDGSPLIDRGRDVGLHYEGTAPDIGAMESSFSGPYELPEPREVTVGTEADFETITQALNVVNQPGSSILIKSGEYSEFEGEVFPLVLYGCSMSAQPPTLKIESSPVLTSDAEDCMVYSNYNGPFMLTGLTFTRAENGAVLLRNSSPIINQCRFTDNHRTAKGAALICVNDSDPEVSNTVLMNNSSQEGAAAVYLSSGCDAVFFNCLIAENFTPQCGAGLYIDDSDPEIRNCTIANNSAIDLGGGMYCLDSEVVIIDSIIRFNVWTQYAGDNYLLWPSYSNLLGFICDGCSMEDPRFIGRSPNRYCLSSVTTGQIADSPCFDAGHAPSSVLCVDSPQGQVCLNSLTTRTDRQLDVGVVDMGYHYPISEIATPTPVPPPVPTQTTPGITLMIVFISIGVILSRSRHR